MSWYDRIADVFFDRDMHFLVLTDMNWAFDGKAADQVEINDAYVSFVHKGLRYDVPRSIVIIVRDLPVKII